MKIFIVAYEFPYPPNHGGKADVWSRIKALKSKGAQIFLLTWYGIQRNDKLDKRAIKEVEQVVDELVLMPIPRNLKRAVRLMKYPSLAAARILDLSVFGEILEKSRKFKADFVLIDGIYAGQTGLKFAEKLKIPACLRTHNVEHKYMLGQYKIASGFRSKLSIMANLIHLRKYEYKIFHAVDAYFDISMDDLVFWKSEGFKNGYWLPPIFNKKAPSNKFDENISPEKFDIGFIGNLHTPNNVKGLYWFIEKVLPLISKSFPKLKILFVGSNPDPKLLDFCEKVEGLSIVANPEFVEPYQEKINILINPVQFGSGTNIKTIEMLFSSKQVVSSSVGVKGIPSDINTVFYIADTPQEFADSILEIIQDKKAKDLSLRNNLRNNFNENAIDKLLSIMQSETAHNKLLK